MKQIRGTNVFIPHHSKAFKMEELNTKILLNEWINTNADSLFDENKIPYGIIDFAKLST